MTPSHDIPTGSGPTPDTSHWPDKCYEQRPLEPGEQMVFDSHRPTLKDMNYFLSEFYGQFRVPPRRPGYYDSEGVFYYDPYYEEDH